MKTILVFGDSLTWGFMPSGAGRYPFEKRWPNIMQAQLGAGVRVIEEALNGRTTVRDSPYAANRSGKEMLPPLLEAHSPLDLVIVMLGTNDLQVHQQATAAMAARGCGALIDIVLKSNSAPGGKSAPPVLLVAPPPFNQPSGMMDLMFGDSVPESRKFGGAYRAVADFFRCHFFDAGSVISSSPVDGIHLDEAETRALGIAIAEVARRILDETA
ncbi:MAG: SGNH/GDSL hydrolase family protein [Gemmataceae bacterium]